MNKLTIDPQSKEHLIRKLTSSRVQQNQARPDRSPEERKTLEGGTSNVHIRSLEENARAEANLKQMRSDRKVRERKRKKQRRQRMTQEEQRVEVKEIFDSLTPYQQKLLVGRR